MYGQRELFHSNLIAWFFDALPEFADRVFKPLSSPGHDSGRLVERERKNLDLVFHWEDRAPVVIENKVFSLPQRDQLDGYASETDNWIHRPALVLLSTSPPDFLSERWHHLDYSELSRRILEAAPPDSSYEVETMRRYAELAADLQALVSATDVGSEDEAVWLPRSLLTAVSSSQMRAALQKARAQRVARLLNALLPGLEKPAAAGMTNATPLVEALEYVQVEGMHVHLGWQLQGEQFRRAVVYHDKSISGHSEDSRRLREQVSEQNLSFFGFPEPLSQQAGGRKDFNHFAPSFVYRYVNAGGLTIAELQSAASAIHLEIRSMRDAGPGAMRPDEAVRRTP